MYYNWFIFPHQSSSRALRLVSTASTTSRVYLPFQLLMVFPLQKFGSWSIPLACIITFTSIHNSLLSQSLVVYRRYNE